MPFRTDYFSAPPRVLLHPTNNMAGGLYRIDQPAKALREAGYAITRVNPTPLTSDTLLALHPDICVVQLFHTDLHLETLTRYRKVLPEMYIVYEIDDLIWDLPANHSSIPLVPHDIKRRVQKAMKLCDSVVTSTDALKDFIHKDLKIAANKITVAKNAVSRSFINAARASDRTRNEKLRVGWAGGVTHGPDLALLRDAVLETRNEFQWVFFGSVMENPALKDIEPYIEHHPGVSITDYPMVLGSLNLDIGIAPLTPSRFNIAKSDLRILEMAAAGVTVVASPIEPYLTSGIGAVIARDWVETLRDLDRNEQKRWAIADSQHKYVLTRRMQESPDNLESWVKAWLPEDSKIFDPTIKRDFAGLPSVVKKVNGGYIFTRQGTEITFDTATYSETAGHYGSVTCLSNDGLYPMRGKFLPLREGATAVINQAAEESRVGKLQVSMPQGPFVFFSEKAVNRIGLPDVHRYGLFEAGILDWSIRAYEAGFLHAIDLDHYVGAEREFQNPELITFANREVQGWFKPEIFAEMETPTENNAESLANRFTSLDLAAFRVSRVPAENGTRALMINANKDMVEAFEANGHAVLTSGVLGHLLSLDPALLPNTPSFDLRREVTELESALTTCGIRNIVVSGLGEGSSDILGSFAKMHRDGFKVTYFPVGNEFACPNQECSCGENSDVCQAIIDMNGSPYGYVNLNAWRESWGRFLETVMPLPEASVTEEIPISG